MTSGCFRSRKAVYTASLIIASLGIETGIAVMGNMSGGSNTLAEAAALVQAGKLDPAIQVYDGIIQHGRTTLDAHEALFRKGMCLQAMKQYQPALACWQTLLGRYANTAWDDDALLEMGETYALCLNQPDKALPCYERLIRDYPKSDRMMEVRYQQAIASYMKGDYAKAKTILEAFLSAYPKSNLTKDAQDWLKRTAVALKATDKPKGQLLMSKASPRHKVMVTSMTNTTPDLSKELTDAEELQKRGNNTEAIKALQAIVKNNVAGQGYDRALFRLGQCYAALNEDERAIETWEVVVKRAYCGQSSDYVDDCLLAQAETWLNGLYKPDKALKCCQTLQAEFPKSDLIPQAEHIVGLVYFQQGEMAKAQVIFEGELVQLRAVLAKTPRTANTNALALRSPDSLRGRHVGGPPTGLEQLVAACQGRLAAGVLLGAELKSFAHAGTLIRMGDMQFMAQDYAKARRVYEKAVREATGTDTAAYALLQAGRCFNQIMQYREALRCYEQFLNRYKQSEWADDALLRAGVIYVGPLNDMKTGIKLYQTVRERYPDSPGAEKALYHLATLAYWNKDWGKALKLHETFVGQYPGSQYLDYAMNHRIPEIKQAMEKAKGKVTGERKS